MKKPLVLIFVLVLLPFFVCGCDDRRAGILFNNEPITRQNLKHASRSFEKGKKIYYLFYSPKKIKAEFVRVQIGKVVDNAPKGGYTIVMSHDHRIMKQNVFYYYDNFVLYQSGRYVMQVFDVENLSEPLAWNYFYVY